MVAGCASFRSGSTTEVLVKAAKVIVVVDKAQILLSSGQLYKRSAVKKLVGGFFIYFNYVSVGGTIETAANISTSRSTSHSPGVHPSHILKNFGTDLTIANGADHNISYMESQPWYLIHPML